MKTFLNNDSDQMLWFFPPKCIYLYTVITEETAYPSLYTGHLTPSQCIQCSSHYHFHPRRDYCRAWERRGICYIARNMWQAQHKLCLIRY